MDFLHESISIFFGLLGVGGEVEVEVSHLALISPVTVEHDDGVGQGGYPFG